MNSSILITLAVAGLGCLLAAQTTVQANGSPRVGAPAVAVAPPAVSEKREPAELLRYSINWPSGLSLGEGTLTAMREGEGWSFSLNLEAAVPGFPVQENVRSKASAGYCSSEMEKKIVRGKRKTEEKTEFDDTKHIATRKTLNGGKSELSLNQCAKDALTYVFFLRRELAQGRLVPRQKIYYGAGYEVRVDFMGTQAIRIAEGTVQADRLVGTIKGPVSEATVDMFFARDAARTPLLVSVPLALGKFSMEIVR
ncbi:MAG TPA: DUF3108 domain-containing protein [Bryobacteraceae bacterium]|nr:DUF3108 domain-containing protein [Bryobacteraceae bacterium]